MPLGGFEVWTGDTSLDKIDYMVDLSLTTGTPGEPSISGAKESTADIGSVSGVLATGATYSFVIYTANDIPKDGYFVLTVPEAITVPTNYATAFTFSCLTGCDDSSASITHDYSTREMSFKNIYPTVSDYLANDGPVYFEINGWTNAENSNP